MKRGVEKMNSNIIGTFLVIVISFQMNVANGNICNDMNTSAEIIKAIEATNLEKLIHIIYENSEEKVEVSEIVMQQNMNDAYKILMSRNEQDLYLIPEGSRLNKVIVLNDEVLLDFSEELLEYGGTLWEEELIKQLLDTAFSFEEIQYVTITIDGEIKNFVEGTTINRYTRENWMKGIN